MILRYLALSIFAACLVAGCDDSVPLSYSSRADAAAENLFARGWLPEIVPPSSRNISMCNDLDLNISNGEFSFEQSDHDGFVSHLDRVSSRDEDGLLAYAYEDWIFWINSDKNYCRFHMRLTRNKDQSEQASSSNGG